MTHPLRILPAAAVLLFLPTGCAQTEALLGGVLGSAPKPSVSVQRGHITDFDFEALTMTFDVEVDNPYAVPLPLTAMRYDLAAGSKTDKPFLTGFTENQGSIPAKGKKELQVPVRVAFDELLRSLDEIKPGMVVPYRANLAFEVEPPGSTEPLALPVSHNGELPVPAPPEIDVEQIQWENLSLAKADGIVKMNVKNPNAFSATLKDLSYHLELNGTSLASGEVDDDIAFDSNNVQSIEIPISVKPLSLGTAVFKMLQGREANYTVKGLLDFDTPYGTLAHDYDKAGKLNLN